MAAAPHPIVWLQTLFVSIALSYSQAIGRSVEKTKSLKACHDTAD
jgi:hypothetical protein